MTKEQSVLIAGILTTLAETPGGEAPTGIMYAAALGRTSLSEFNAVIGAMVGARLLTHVGNHVVKLTEAGREAANKIEAALAEGK